MPLAESAARSADPSWSIGTNAVEQAAIITNNITQPTGSIECAPVEYVWSDQYDWKIRVAGEAGIAENRHVEVISEAARAGRFAAAYSPDGQAFSGMVVVNWPRALVAGRKALAQRTPYPVIRDELARLAQPQHIIA